MDCLMLGMETPKMMARNAAAAGEERGIEEVKLVCESELAYSDNAHEIKKVEVPGARA